VRELASSTKGGDMEAWIRRIVTAVGLAATAALFLVHTLPSSDPGDALRAVAGATIAATGVAAFVLLVTSWRRATLPPNLPPRGRPHLDRLAPLPGHPRHRPAGIGRQGQDGGLADPFRRTPG